MTALPTKTTAVPTMRGYDVGVDAVQRLGPSTLRLTFGGESLAGFDPAGELGPRDMRVKLLIPRPGQRLPDLTDLDEGWYQQWLALPEDDRGCMRTYTIRRARPEASRPQVEIDFVVHVDEQGRQGPASDFASRAVVGDRLTILGPYRVPGTSSRSDEVYGGIEFRPPVATAGRPVRLLLAGDETAAPAICSILETLPDGYAGHAVIEVPSRADEQQVRASGAAGDIAVRWLERGDRPRGELLTAAVADLVQTMATAGGPSPVPGEASGIDVDSEILWETPEYPAQIGGRTDADTDDSGDFYAWLAGEAAMIRDLRRLLVRDHGVDRTRVAFMGYWRVGRSEG